MVGMLVYFSTCLWSWKTEAAQVFSAFLYDLAHQVSDVGTYRSTTWWADRSPELCSAQLWLSWHRPVAPSPLGQSSEGVQGAGHIIQIRSIDHIIGSWWPARPSCQPMASPPLAGLPKPPAQQKCLLYLLHWRTQIPSLPLATHVFQK